MFIKITKNPAGQAYYHLIETYRDQGKVKQRTLLSLGKVGEDRIDQLAHAISRHRDLFTALDLAKQVSVDKAYVLGPLLILQKLFACHGLDALLSKLAQLHPKLGFNLRDLVFTMVATQFVKPGSKLKVYEYWRKRFYPRMIVPDIKLHQLYRTLDILAKHKDEIEKDLYWHGRDLLTMSVDVVLYDLTTLRFESIRTDKGTLRQFGYSKERRSDCTQVVLGLLVTPEGIPLGFEVYPGNTFEGKTITDIVDKLKNKYRVRRFILIGDRGLFSRKNLLELRGNHQLGEFIVGMKLGMFKKRDDEFYDMSRFQWVNSDFAMYETTHEGDLCIVIWSRARAERDRKAREDVLLKIRKKLAKKTIKAKDFVSNKTYQRYVTGLSEGETFALNESAIAEDSRRDGFFGVVTNISGMNAKAILDYYKTLWIVEDAFGELKGTLRARPVFHWTDNRIIGHLVLCFMAYYCEAHLTHSLRIKNKNLESPAIRDGTVAPRPLTVVEAMRELNDVLAIPVSIPSATVWVRTDVTGNEFKAFSALGLRAPPKILTIEKQEEGVVAQTAAAPVSV
jgi:transposase